MKIRVYPEKMKSEVGSLKKAKRGYLQADSTKQKENNT